MFIVQKNSKEPEIKMSEIITRDIFYLMERKTHTVLTCGM